jgi:hypothetical protein
MEVWIAEVESAVHPAPYPTLASRSKVTASGTNVVENGIKEPKLTADGEQPSSSTDATSYYDWLPQRGTKEWIAYEFDKPATVSRADVYWFQPERGEIKVPASWSLFYRDGETWKPVEAQGSYGVALDRFNTVSFKPVTTTALRLEMQLQPGRSAAISEWKVQ